MNVSFFFSGSSSDDSSGAGIPPRLELLRDTSQRLEGIALSVEDAELASGIRSGDASAFTRMVELHANGALIVAYRELHSQDSARDAVQNALALLWQHRASFKPTRSVKSYVYRAVRNQALKMAQPRGLERGRERVEYESVANAGELNDGVAHDAVNNHLTIEALLATLSSRARLAVELRYLEQMSYSEVGDALEISPKAAEQLVLRALARLRRQK